MKHTLLGLFLFTFLLSAHAAPCGVAKFPDFQLQYCQHEKTHVGPWVVFETAQGTDLHVWPQPFLQKINRFARVLVYNRIGYGQSRYLNHKLHKAITAQQVSEQLLQLLDQQKIHEPVVLVAHSIGGIYVQYFARHYPRRVNGMVLIDASSAAQPRKNSPFINRAPLKPGSAAYYENAGFVTSMDQVQQSPPFPNIPLLVLTAEDNAVGIAPSNVIQWWHRLQVQMAKQSPRGKQISIRGTGHYIFLDKPQVVIDAIKKITLDK